MFIFLNSLSIIQQASYLNACLLLPPVHCPWFMELIAVSSPFWYILGVKGAYLLPQEAGKAYIMIIG
jgi:hypothetical protein